MSSKQLVQTWWRRENEVTWSLEASEHPEIVAVVIVGIRVDADGVERGLSGSMALIEGPAWQPGADHQDYLTNEVVPLLERGDDKHLWVRQKTPSQVQVALSAAGVVPLREAPIVDLRGGYKGSVELFEAEPEWWAGGEVDADVVALLDVTTALGEPIHAKLFLAPHFGDFAYRDVQELVDLEVRPRLDRLHAHGPDPDSWRTVSTGHLQLTLVESPPPPDLGPA